MNQVLPEIIRHACYNILPARLERRVPERRECVRFVEAVVMKTPADENPGVLCKALVEPQGNLICIQLPRRSEGKSPGGGIRIWNVFGKEQRLRRKTCRRDDIVRELNARLRIVDPSGSYRAEIAALHRRRRYDAVEYQSLALPHPFVAGKEKRLVPPIVKLRNRDRSAKGAAELIALEDFALPGEEV